MNKFTPSILLPNQNFIGNTYFPKPKLIKTNIIDGFGNSINTNNNLTIRDSYGNNIGNNSNNIQLFASNNNRINGNLTNVVIINTDNTTVTESNVTYINGVKFNPYGVMSGASINWGSIGGTLSNQVDLQAALDSKFNNPGGTASQYIKGDGSLGTFPTDVYVTGGTFNSSTNTATFTNNTGGTFNVTGFTSSSGGTGSFTGITAITSTDFTIFADVVNNSANLSVRALAVEIRNETGVPLTKGQAVYLSGASGNKSLAWLAQANSEATSSGTIGLVLEDIPTNQNGFCISNGKIEKLDTTAFSAGTKLWLSATVAGGLTSTIPNSPNHPVHIGIVSRSHVNQGTIELNIINTPELRELSDVSASTITNGQTLVWDSTLSVFKPFTLTNGTTFTGGTVTGSTYFSNGLSANTFSATTYLGLPAQTTIANDPIWVSAGDIVYGTGANTAARLSGNTSSTKRFLTSQGSGGLATAPTWSVITSADIAGILLYQNLSIPTSGGTFLPTPGGYRETICSVSGLSSTLTISAPSGSFVDGDKLVFRIIDNGTLRTLSFSTAAGGYIQRGATVPTSTITINKWSTTTFLYNSLANKWDCVGYVIEF